MQIDYFTGFPYLVTLVSRGLFHISILPSDAGLENLKEIVRWQVSANKLRSCLVLGPTCCIYFELDGAERTSSDIPQGGVNVAGRLRTAWSGSGTAEFSARGELLRTWLDQHGAHEMIYAELTKGGRAGTADELRLLEGKQPNGVPVGLTKCARCGRWRGECLDPAPAFRGLVMRVDCQCDNDTLCAACSETLWEKRLNANYYDERRGRIWFVPGFKAFSHVCPVKAETQRRRRKARAVCAGAMYAQ